ncbi:MAG TPA: hypothetical protein VLF71_05950 [Candidatus Saccharimonadales bacterium]|nr:hypothetical protein [Candidatus Saccharimonadales bacterium]
MAESAPATTPTLDPTVRRFPDNAPVSPAGPHGIDPNLVRRIETAADQGAMLQDLINNPDGLNGVPDAEARAYAQQFTETLRHSRADDPADPIPGRGTYFDREGNRLDTNMVEDLMAAARPDGWVLGPAQSDVLRTARDILSKARPGTPIPDAHIPVLETARQLAMRHSVHGEIDANTLKRLLRLDADARNELHRKPRVIRRLEAASDNYLSQALPVEPVTARKTVTVVEPEAFPGENERLVRPDELHRGTNARGRAVSTRVHVETPGGYATSAEGVLTPETARRMSEAEIFSYLLNNKDIRTAADIARVLYPNRVRGGNGVYGDTTRRQGASNEHRRLEEALTPAEDVVVSSLANKLELVRGREAGIPGDFRDGIAEATYEDLAAELYPDVADPNDLTLQQNLIVRSSLSRLRSLRSKQVRKDHLVGAQMAASRGAERVRKGTKKWGKQANELVQQTREALQKESLRDRIRRHAGAAAMRGAMSLGRAIGNVQGTAILAKRRLAENLNLDALKVRGAMMIGSAVLATQAAGNRLRNVEWGDATLRLSSLLYNTATGAVATAQAYARERVEAFRSMDPGERNYRVGSVLATVALAGTAAVAAYLQQHHGAELPGGFGRQLPNQAFDHLPTGGSNQFNPADHLPTGGGAHQNINPTDHLPNGNGHHAAATETAGSNSMNPNDTHTNTGPAHPNTAPGASSNGHEVVKVGKFNAHNKIQGYPEGSAGYRILEAAQRHGLNVGDRSHANRLIDATLKANKIGWNQKLGDEHSITLLTDDQMKQLLG